MRPGDANRFRFMDEGSRRALDQWEFVAGEIFSVRCVMEQDRLTPLRNDCYCVRVSGKGKTSGILPPALLGALEMNPLRILVQLPNADSQVLSAGSNLGSIRAEVDLSNAFGMTSKHSFLGPRRSVPKPDGPVVARRCFGSKRAQPIECFEQRNRMVLLLNSFNRMNRNSLLPRKRTIIRTSGDHFLKLAFNASSSCLKNEDPETTFQQFFHCD